MSGPQAIAKSPRTGDGPLWMGGCIGGSLNGGASAANAADTKKRGENTSARCGVPFRYAPCASPALIRLLQCAPEELKITFLAEFEILHQCSLGPEP